MDNTLKIVDDSRYDTALFRRESTVDTYREPQIPERRFFKVDTFEREV
jgi:hypothetical protein